MTRFLASAGQDAGLYTTVAAILYWFTRLACGG